MNSSETVKNFLKDKDALRKQKEARELAELKYKVLSHYNLGEMEMYEGKGDKNDYSLYDNDNWGGTQRFKYNCEISDEDFEKVYEIYKNETVEPEKTHNSGAENTLNVCATIILIIGILSLIIFGIIAVDDSHYHTVFHWDVFSIGLGVFFVSLITSAFARVIVNISSKLNNLKK